MKRQLEPRDGVILAVTGSRKPEDLSPPWSGEVTMAALRSMIRPEEIGLLVEGGASGFDRWAGIWAEANGVPHRMEPALWDDIDRPGAIIRTRRDGSKYDAGAGPARNQRIIDKWKPSRLIAFPGGKGTQDMVKRARAAGLRIAFPDPDIPLSARFSQRAS